MMNVRTNASQIAARFRRRAERLGGALKSGLRDAAAQIDRYQVENLRGSNAADPGDYPVPARTGHLLGTHFWDVKSETLAIVGNTAEYAVDIHEGRGSSAEHGRRPFLDDAAEATDAVEIMAVEVRREALHVD